MSVTFYLGVHHPSWLGRIAAPAFVSHRRLAGLRRLPRAMAPWVADSGGYSELNLHRTWTVTPIQYVTAVRRYRDEIGRLDWAAPQDWMCEPQIVARTGLDVSEHQRRTVENYLRLRDLAPDLPFAPVVQGMSSDEYQRCADLYDRAGVDLAAQPVVAVGTLCRRQHRSDIVGIIERLHARGLALHAFGVKVTELSRCSMFLRSADSMAWSYSGRFVAGCAPGHATEANCLSYALAWRARLLARIAEPDVGCPQPRRRAAGGVVA